jgi:hypothetical protein
VQRRRTHRVLLSLVRIFEVNLRDLVCEHRRVDETIVLERL